jgi:hypothetical protein
VSVVVRFKPVVNTACVHIVLISHTFLADHLAHYRDSLIRDHEELGQCRQCNRKRQLHNKWPLCLACLKHNTAHTKQFKQRYAVDPKLDLELFVFGTSCAILFWVFLTALCFRQSRWRDC